VTINESWIEGYRHGVPVVRGATSEAVIANPWQWYRWLRVNAPVAWSDELQGYLATRYGEVRRICMDDGSIFSSKALSTQVPNIFSTDDPDHKRYRLQAVKNFTSRYVRSLEPFIRETTEQRVAKILETSSFDLFTDLAEPLPMDVICHIMGVPKVDAPLFAGWVQSVFKALASGLGYNLVSGDNPLNEISELGVYFTALIERARRNPQNDVIARLVNDSGDLDDYEVLLLIVTLALGGHVTTGAMIGEGLRLGLQRPDIWNKVCAKGSWRDFSEEVLRFETPVHTVARMLRQSGIVEGHELPAGSRIYAYLGSANRDADAFVDPDSFSLNRGRNPHLAFGAGPHACIGSGLSHLEARVVFETMANILPRFEIVPGLEQQAVGIGRRALAHLPVRLRSGRASNSRRFAGAQRAARTAKVLTKLVRPQDATSIADELAEMRGVVMKIGQLFSFIDLPGHKEYGAAFTRLQQDAAARPYVEIQSVISELGERLSELDIEKTAIAAASIGQVHRAVTQSGDRLALKVQYPDAREVIESDLRNGRLLTRFLGSMARLLGLPLGQLDVADLMSELTERIRSELDYSQEARHQEEFRLLHQDTSIVIPRVHIDLCTERLLVMDWVDGMSWREAMEAPQTLRNEWGRAVFRFVFSSLYGQGLFNADPHPGNYLFRSDGSVGFLDFGCIKEFGAEQVHALLEIDDHMRVFNYEAAQEALGMMGVVVSGGALRTWLDTLYEPLTSPQPFCYNAQYASALYDSYVGLTKQVDDSTGVAMPRDLLFMNRINLGVHNVLAGLRATCDWRAELDRIRNLPIPTLPKRRNRDREETPCSAS